MLLSISGLVSAEKEALLEIGDIEELKAMLRYGVWIFFVATHDSQGGTTTCVRI